MGNRILLVYDDYQECENWHQLLQKLGFQIESVRTEAGVLSQLLSLRPDAVFLHGRGYQINPINVLEKLTNQTWFNGKIVIFESQQYPLYMADLAQYRFDGLLPSTTFDDIEKLEIISQVLAISFQQLFDKYQAIFGVHQVEKPNVPLRPSSLEVSSKSQLANYRAKRSKSSSVNGHQVPTSLSKESIQTVIKQSLRVTSQESEDLISQKREFVRALFVKD